MTFSPHAYEGIRILSGSEVLNRLREQGIGSAQFDGKPRFRSTAKPTGEIPLFDLRKASETAAMSLRGRIFARRAE